MTVTNTPAALVALLARYRVYTASAYEPNATVIKCEMVEERNLASASGLELMIIMPNSRFSGGVPALENLQPSAQFEIECADLLFGLTAQRSLMCLKGGSAVQETDAVPPDETDSTSDDNDDENEDYDDYLDDDAYTGNDYDSDDCKHEPSDNSRQERMISAFKKFSQ